ncbi:MAG: hypothetical protein IJ566_00100 [Cardiobacteriaceae bacterium]|nr:hypothetical protein [Cardiobacteriaceae bacterium]
MTKQISVLILSALLLAACANGEDAGNTVSKAIITPILNNECHSQLEQQKLWQVAKLQFGAQAQEYANRVCSCASEEAAERITPAQMIKLSSDAGRIEVAKEVIPPTLSACYQKLIK